MRSSWILLILGVLLIAGAAYVALTHSHLDVGLQAGGMTTKTIRVDCGTALFHKYPKPLGMNFGAKGPCGARSGALTRVLFGATLGLLAGLGCVAMGLTGMKQGRGGKPATGA